MDSVITSRQAAERHGTTTVRTKISRGLWQRPRRGVVVTHNGPLTRDERDRIIVLAAPPGSALGGLTALRYDGLTGFTSDQTFVVFPDGHRPRRLGAVIHYSTMLDERDVHVHREPRRTSPARSVCDAATWGPSHRFARTIVLAAFQQGLVNLTAMRDALGRRGKCKRRSVIIQSVLDAVGGMQSLPERDFDEIVRGLGLPRPARQHPVRGPEGRYYLDVVWPAFGVSVEVHGTHHHEVAQWSADLARGNELAISGRRTLSFTSFSIRHEREAVADQLARMFRQHGWSPHRRKI